DKNSYGLNWLANLEGEIAKFSKDNNLNARIVRLSAVFGPRMHFREKDSIIRLIEGQETSLEFSTRAIFITDAISLIIKSMLAGSTAQKIFDGSLLQPIQISEIKQILLDPVWYGEKGFKPTELPPWPTPNLKSTLSHVNWEPKVNLVDALKETTLYFSKHPANLNEPKSPEQFDKGWREEEREKGVEKKEEAILSPVKKEKKQFSLKMPIKKEQILVSIGWLVIFYALIFPLIVLIFGVFTFRYSLDLATKDLQEGEYTKSLNDVSRAKEGLKMAESWFGALTVFEKMGILTTQINEIDEILDKSINLSEGLEHLILGSRAMTDGFKKLTQDSNGTTLEEFSKASFEFENASGNFSKINLALKNIDFSTIPTLRVRVEDLITKIDYFERLSNNGHTAAEILKSSFQGKKTFVLVLQNSLLLRPTGGKIIELTQIDIEDGKLKKVAMQDAIDLESLIKENHSLSEANEEANFPTTASKIKLFFNKLTGKEIDGVLTIDTKVLKELIKITGPVEVEGFGKIDEENLLEKALKGDNKLLVSLQKELLNRILFGLKGTVPKVGDSLINLFEQKHIEVFMFDTNLENLIEANSLNTNLLTSNLDKSDVLFWVESNISNNLLGEDLGRSFKLKTEADEKGNLTHKLSATLINRNPDQSYKSLVKIYVPLGSLLLDAKLENSSVKTLVSTFSDYNKTGYSITLDINPKSELTFEIEYKTGSLFNKGNYILNVLKQAGTNNNSFEWEFKSPDLKKKIQTDLKVDKEFRL
ncbi:MAG: Uncharacterized protein G01um101493_284, partial [Microgenomates group bacterium Gr01-1014_93]